MILGVYPKAETVDLKNPSSAGLTPATPIVDFFTLKERLIMNSKNYFLIAAFASFILSVGLWFLGDQAVAKQQGFL